MFELFDKTILIGSVFFVVSIYSQVGINTATPTKMLHVQGNMRVRDLTNQSDAKTYDRILITDANGNIDYATKSAMIPLSFSGAPYDKISQAQIYNMTTNAGNNTKHLKCGKFEFRFNTGSGTTDSNETPIQFRLAADPGGSVSVYMSMEQNWNPNGYQFYQGNAVGNNNPYIFNSGNWNDFINFNSANLASGEQNVMHFQYPNDLDFYRLTIYKITQNVSGSSYDFASVCEKF